MRIIKMKKYVIFTVITMLFLFTGCMKEFLDLKRDKSQVTPASLQDFRALLDDNGTMNYNFPNLGIIGADEYYVTAAQWEALTSPVGKNAYIWNDEIYEGNTGDDWNRGFEKVMLANFVMEGVLKIDETTQNQDLRNELLGEAHFYRSLSYFMMTQLFCKQYVEDEASSDLGLPLRITSNINVHYPRAKLDETYNFIIDDIKEAIRLMPVSTEVNTRPNKGAALALGAIICLQMGKLNEGVIWAEEAFSLNNELLDYNGLNFDVTNPFSQYGRDNPEILYYGQVLGNPILYDSRMNVDMNLYKSYDDDDLRKKSFFRYNNGRLVYNGGYTGTTTSMFVGITTAELYLLMAEYKLRIDNSSKTAVKYINDLLKKRMKKDAFDIISESIPVNECRSIIINERKKELVFQGRRWWDLRRYKEEGVLQEPLKRIIGDTVYELPLKSGKWVWPLPPDVIAIGNLEQNVR